MDFLREFMESYAKKERNAKGAQSPFVSFMLIFIAFLPSLIQMAKEFFANLWEKSSSSSSSSSSGDDDNKSRSANRPSPRKQHSVKAKTKPIQSRSSSVSEEDEAKPETSNKQPINTNNLLGMILNIANDIKGEMSNDKEQNAGSNSSSSSTEDIDPPPDASSLHPTEFQNDNNIFDEIEMPKPKLVPQQYRVVLERKSKAYKDVVLERELNGKYSYSCTRYHRDFPVWCRSILQNKSMSKLDASLFRNKCIKEEEEKD